MQWFRQISLFFILSLMALPMVWASNSTLLVSTQPIYLIAQAITQGIETPVLLLENQSGHDVHLSPADRKKIQDANLILWIGKEHETPLQKVLQGNKQAVSILDAGLINRLPQRNAKAQALAKTVDTHVWLDPNHAVRIGFFIASLRGQQYPSQKDRYWANAQRFADELFKQSQRYRYHGEAQPYWSYHDAYQYLEQALNLKFVGALTTDTHHGSVTAAQIKYLADQRPQKRMCLLAEGHVTASQYQHLQPVVFTQVDESFRNEKNFIEAWKKLAQNIQQCVYKARN